METSCAVSIRTNTPEGARFAVAALAFRFTVNWEGHSDACYTLARAAA